MEKIYIKQYVRIRNDYVRRDGEDIFAFSEKPGHVENLLLALYEKLDPDYRKFFKMDTLSKAGFLAAEMLFGDCDREQPKEDTGVILFNSASSLIADNAYYETIRDQENYFPSPAIFVYTLPNIVTGEIAIRHKIHGETSFYVLPRFQAENMVEIIQNSIFAAGMKQALVGWIEVSGGEADVLMMLCVAGENKDILLTYSHLNHLYSE
ncbi:MAG: hypothetical protein LBR49_07330 [Tannerella sp.]|jgi:hypothetical protein|nr:hypothetical protein [Tannerella sp.]